jgi:hypothetical protein
MDTVFQRTGWSGEKTTVSELTPFKTATSWDLPSTERTVQSISLSGWARAIDILRQRRGRKGERDVNLCIFELANRARRIDGDTLLRQGRSALGTRADKAERLAVDADEAGERLLLVRPVLRVLVRQLVGMQPDARGRDRKRRAAPRGERKSGRGVLRRKQRGAGAAYESQRQKGESEGFHYGRECQDGELKASFRAKRGTRGTRAKNGPGIEDFRSMRK